MSRDRIDELASELFAAAREERPARELVTRVERGVESGERGAPQPELARASERRLSARGRSAFARTGVRVLWAALVAGAVGAVLLLPRAREGVIISAERAPNGASGSGVASGSAGMAGGAEGSSATVEPSPAPELAPTPAPELAPPSPRAAPPDGDEGRSDDKRVAQRPPRSSEAIAPPPRAAATRPREPEARDEGASNATSAPAPATPPTLASELGAIKQIRQALRSHDGASALVLLDRYDTGEYGKNLSLEASVLRVEALDAVGRRAEAEALARRFVRDNPDSPLAERAQSFIGSANPARQTEGASP